MQHKVKLPRLGDTVQEVVVIDWVCEVGATVAPGQVLMTVETDKVDADVPSPVAGALVEHLVAAGDEIEVGTPICIIDS